MRRFVAVRLLHAIVVLLVVATIAFFLIHLAPGDPFSSDAPGSTPEIRDRLRRQFGYDRPILEQYARYIANVARGELGFSHMLQAPVGDVLWGYLARTFALMGLGLALSFGFGIWLGAFEAGRVGTRSARLTNAFSLLVYSLPSFWVALMALLVLAYWIPVLPAGGMTDIVMHDYMTPGQAVWDRVRHLILPVATLTLVGTAAVARFQRSALFDVLPSDFVRTARAKGVPEHAVVRRHALRNALLPMITLAGLVFPALLGGAVFVERVFSWPGMGLLLTQAISARDYSVVLASVIVGAVMVTVGNLLADIGYAFADPRVRVG